MLKTVLRTVLLAILMPGPAEAGPHLAVESWDDSTVTMQERVDEVLDTDPEAEQTEWNEVSWDDGEVVLTLDPTSTTDGQILRASTAMSKCPKGSYCAFSKRNYTGDRLRISSCINRSTTAMTAVNSVANARTSGTVRAYNGRTRAATVTARSGKSSITSKVTRLTCDS